MRTDVRGTRLYLPDSDAQPWNPARPQTSTHRRASRASGAQPERLATTDSSDRRDRWGWYRPASILLAVGLAATVVFAALRSPAYAPSRTVPASLTSARELREAGGRALALVNYPWRELGYEIVFAPGEKDVRAQTDVVARRITVFLTKGDAAHRVAHDIGHELGHAYDARYLSEADRSAFLAARGKPKARWFPGTKFSDYDVGAGDFAEVFASCHAASPEFRSRVAAKPAEPCNLIPAPRPGVK